MNKINSLIPLIAGVAALLTTGCVGTKQFVPFPDQSKAVEDPSKGRIYVMRPAKTGTAVSMPVSEDGKPIGITGVSSYLCWERPPGDSIISSSSEGVSQLPLTVNPGKAYYIVQHQRMGVWRVRGELELLDTDNGLKILKKCHRPKVQLKSDPSLSK